MDTSLKQQLKDSGYKGEFDLSSLIDAYGDKFSHLKQYKTIHGLRFDAIGNPNGISEAMPIKELIHAVELNTGIEALFETPEIAVAKLWIKLNEGINRTFV